MPIQSLRVSGYRSIRDIRLNLKTVNVLVGENGCGKSNLYQSMYLLASAAHGELARTFAEEGGMPSTLWAGPTPKLSSKQPVRVNLGVTLGDMDYEIRCGLPVSPGLWGQGQGSLFLLDPEVKEEVLRVATGNKRTPWVTLMERDHGVVSVRDTDGQRMTYPFGLSTSESVLAHLREPHRYPQLSAVVMELRNWRFYHQFRTDAASPMRQPQVGVRTPVLDTQGRSLAAALQTIREVGDLNGLATAIDNAFPGAELDIEANNGRFELTLTMPGLLRPLEARELSDGTLRYLCLLAALLSPRPPALLALNEPETSLHPDLLEPLSRLIADASMHSQLWITTHSGILAEAIEAKTGEASIRLEKINGETRVRDQSAVD